MPGSDTPVFKCRKVLTFSDSEEEEEVHTEGDNQESNISKPVAIAAVKPTAVGQRNTRVVIEREVCTLDAVKDSAQNQQVQSVSPKRATTRDILCGFKKRIFQFPKLQKHRLRNKLTSVKLLTWMIKMTLVTTVHPLKIKHHLVGKEPTIQAKGPDLEIYLLN